MICINDDPDAFTNPKFYYIGDLDGLKEGEIYTVINIYPTKPAFWIKSDYEVVLSEIKRLGGRGFAIERFRYLDIARLDELLKEPIQLTIYVGEEKEKEKVDGDIG